MQPQPKNTAQSGEQNIRTGASWFWLGLIGAVVAIMVASVIYMLRAGSYGVDRNRGPASEGLPGPRGIDSPRPR